MVVRLTETAINKALQCGAAGQTALHHIADCIARVGVGADILDLDWLPIVVGWRLLAIRHGVSSFGAVRHGMAPSRARNRHRRRNADDGIKSF